MTINSDTKTRVLYNADCPVCSLEIEHYAKISKTNCLPVAFNDLNDPEHLREWGLTREDAAKRLHVLSGDNLLSGIPAFIALWRQMPKYKWLARFVALPGIYRVAVWIYDGVLAPLLYWWDKRRTGKT